MLEGLDHYALSDRFAGGALLHGAVEGVDPEFALTRVRIGGETLLLPGTGFEVGASLRLYVRARDVAVALARPDAMSIRNCLPARVLKLTLDAQGPYAQVVLDVQGDHLQAQLTRAAVSDLQLSEGQEVFALLKSVAVASSYFGAG